MQNELDLFTASVYDIEVGKNRTLDMRITCTYLSGDTTMYFDFSTFTGSTLTVKNNSGTILMTFSTTDGSIVLLPNGVFQLVKTDEEMDVVRAGCYKYDMILQKAGGKRAFLYGKITWIQNITN